MKRFKKDFILLFAAVLLVAVFIKGTNFQTVEEYYLTHIDDIKPDSHTVFISISCDTVFDNLDKLDPQLKGEGYFPQNGVILSETEYVLREGDTAFDLLDRTARHNKIQMEYQGADLNGFGSTYIKGISFLYEFSCGPLSGWMYKINGEFPAYGSSKIELKDGDRVEWVYSCDLGRDVGSDIGGWQNG